MCIRVCWCVPIPLFRIFGFHFSLREPGVLRVPRQAISHTGNSGEMASVNDDGGVGADTGNNSIGIALGVEVGGEGICVYYGAYVTYVVYMQFYAHT